jgi:hypothetical protein
MVTSFLEDAEHCRRERVTRRTEASGVGGRGAPSLRKLGGPADVHLLPRGRRVLPPRAGDGGASSTPLGGFPPRPSNDGAGLSNALPPPSGADAAGEDSEDDILFQI